MATRQARRRQQRVAQRTGKAGRRATPWYLTPKALVGAVIAIAIIVVIFVEAGNNAKKPTNVAFVPQSVPSSVLSAVTSSPASTVSAVSSGGLANPWTAIKGKSLTKDGKPELLYIGAEYCPYCGGERWALINALSRFGKFSGLKLMQSYANDLWPSTNTFTLRDATYSSRYLAFVSREETNSIRQPLQQATAKENALLTSYDTGGGIPFLDLANQGTTSIPAGFNVGVLHTHPTDENAKGSLSWQTIANDLTVPQTGVAKAIIGDANWLTAGICKMTNNKPTKTCGNATIQGMESKIKLGK